MTRKLLTCALLGLLAFAPPAMAQSWPAKPVRIIVPFAPGSFTDSAARVLGAELSNQFGQQFIVDNRGGAGGTLGANLAAKAAPDGYTLVLTDNSLSMSAGLYPNLAYDPLKDFVHVSLIAESPSILLVRNGLGPTSVKELVDLAKAKPGELSFGSGGLGSSAHLATELFLNVTGTKMTHVPFRGVAASIAEVVAGRIDMSIASLASGAAQVKAGTLIGLGVTGKARSSQLPEVPTFVEAGVPAYDMSYWWGIAAPAATPAPIVEQLNKAIAQAAQSPRLKDAFAAQGATPTVSSPEELTRHLTRDIAVWKEVIQKANVKVE